MSKTTGLLALAGKYRRMAEATTNVARRDRNLAMARHFERKSLKRLQPEASSPAN